MFDRKRQVDQVEPDYEEKSCRIDKVDNGFTVYANGARRVYLTFDSLMEDLKTYLV